MVKQSFQICWRFFLTPHFIIDFFVIYFSTYTRYKRYVFSYSKHIYLLFQYAYGFQEYYMLVNFTLCATCFQNMANLHSSLSFDTLSNL